MVDLIHWSRTDGEKNGERVHIFETVKELSEYTRKSGKIFQNTFRKGSRNENVVLRHLLRYLFPVKEEMDE